MEVHVSWGNCVNLTSRISEVWGQIKTDELKLQWGAASLTVIHMLMSDFTLLLVLLIWVYLYLYVTLLPGKFGHQKPFYQSEVETISTPPCKITIAANTSKNTIFILFSCHWVPYSFKITSESYVPFVNLELRTFGTIK